MLGEIVVSAGTAILATYFMHIFLLRQQMKVAVDELSKKLDEELNEMD